MQKKRFSAVKSVFAQKYAQATKIKIKKIFGKVKFVIFLSHFCNISFAKLYDEIIVERYSQIAERSDGKIINLY